MRTMMYKRIVFFGLTVAAFFSTECASIQKKPQYQAVGDVKIGHELLRKRDLEGAMAEFRAVFDREPTPEGEFRIGCVLYLQGDIEEAKTAYESYLKQKKDPPKWDRDEVAKEIKRIESAQRNDRGSEEKSLAGRRLRAEYLLLQATEAFDSNKFGEAADRYEAAAKLVPDAKLWFEAALTATKAGKYDAACKNYKAFLSKSEDEIDERLAYSIQAEIFRLEAVIEGKNSPQGDSLADKVYEARARNEEFLGDEPEKKEPPAEASNPAPEAGTENPNADSETVLPLTAKEKAQAQRKAKQEERRAKREERRQKREALKAERKAREEEKKREKEKINAEKVEAPGDESPSSSPEQAPVENAETLADASEVKPDKEAASPRIESVDANQSAANLNALLKYLDSPSSAVRLKAVRELAKVQDPKAARALEQRVLQDTSVQVRIGAVDALVECNLVESIPVINRAIMTSSNSQERAAFHRAIRHLTGTDRIREVVPEVSE